MPVNIESPQVSKENSPKVVRQDSTSVGWFHSIVVMFACFGATVGGGYVLLQLF